MRSGALVLCLVLGSVAACAESSERTSFLDDYFPDDIDTLCANVVTLGGINAAAATAMVNIQSQRPDLGFTQPEIAAYLGDRCRGL